MTTMTEEPDILAAVRWCRELEDPIQRLVAATKFGDRARDELLTELAGQRRMAAAEARDKLVAEGHTVARAVEILAEKAGTSPQTIMRLVLERKTYGG